MTPNELKIIDSISKNQNISQRDISKHIGASLGLTNIIVNRLIKKGYLKASRLNPRKIKYMVTPKGIKEKTKKTYKFMKRSFSVINELKDFITDSAIKKYNNKSRRFLILGSGELSDICELVLNSLKLEDVQIERIDRLNPIENHTVIFNTTQDNSLRNKKNVVNIFEKAEKIYGSKYEF
ncbi:MAG: winged helix-turn-helix transcriptional regulator [Elusimicrobiota bacterium]